MFEDLHARSQADLIEFVERDLDLVTTFLSIARTDSDQPDHATEPLGRAREAIANVRHFAERIEDTQERDRILNRAAEVERVGEMIARKLDEPSS